MINLSNGPKSWIATQEYLRNCIAKTVAVGALPVFAFALSVGTGGLNTSDFYQARGDVGYRNPYIMLRVADTPTSLGASQNLKLVFDVLQINHSELARTLNVSRQAIYNWLDGENISSDNSERLANLAVVAELFVGFDRRKIKDLLRRKLDGRTLLEVVAQGHSATAFAKQLISIATRDEVQRSRLSQRLLGKPKNEYWADQLGTPHLSEEG